MAEIQKIQEGQTGQEVAELLYANDLEASNAGKLKTHKLDFTTSGLTVITSPKRFGTLYGLLVVKFTKVSTVKTTIETRSYSDDVNITSSSILSTVESYSKPWQWGDNTIVTRVEGVSNILAFIITAEGATIESITFTELLNPKETRINGSVSLFFNAGSAVEGQEGQKTNIFLTKGVKVDTDFAVVNIGLAKPFGKFKVEIVWSTGARADYSDIVEFTTVYEGVGKLGSSQQIEIPFRCETRNFRVRVTALEESETKLRFISVTPLENAPESIFNTNLPFTEIVRATIEEKPLKKVYEFVNITNPSSSANVIVKRGNYQQIIPPFGSQTFPHVFNMTLKLDRGAEDLIVGYDHTPNTMVNDGGKPTKVSAYNIRGINLIRPYPMTKRVFWGTKTKDNELWRFDLNSKYEVEREELLQTFPYPITDIFVTDAKSILICTGDIYPTDGVDKTRFKLYRSTYPAGNWGKVVEEVTTAGDTVWLPRMGIDQRGSSIVYGEYAIDKETVSLVRSVDDGKTWVKTHTLQVPNEARHIHTVTVDRIEGWFYATTGDSGDQLKWLLSKNGGASWEVIQMEVNQNIKILGMDISQDKIICVTDSPGVDNYIIAFDKNDLNKRTFLYRSQNVFFGLVRVDDALLAYEVSQHAGNAQVQNGTYKTKIVISFDEGKTWDTVTAWEASSASGNAGFRYAGMPSRDGEVVLRTDRPLLEGHFLNQNTIILKIK